MLKPTTHIQLAANQTLDENSLTIPQILGLHRGTSKSSIINRIVSNWAPNQLTQRQAWQRTNQNHWECKSWIHEDLSWFIMIYLDYRWLQMIIWLVVWTPLKNISQLGWFFPIYGKIKNVPNHQPVLVICNSRSFEVWKCCEGYPLRWFSSFQWHNIMRSR